MFGENCVRTSSSISFHRPNCRSLLCLHQPAEQQGLRHGGVHPRPHLPQVPPCAIDSSCRPAPRRASNWLVLSVPAEPKPCAADIVCRAEFTANYFCKGCCKSIANPEASSVHPVLDGVLSAGTCVGALDPLPVNRAEGHCRKLC